MEPSVNGFTGAMDTLQLSTVGSEAIPLNESTNYSSAAAVSQAPTEAAALSMTSGSGLGFAANSESGDEESNADKDSAGPNNSMDLKDVRSHESAPQVLDSNINKSITNSDVTAPAPLVTNSSDARGERIENMRQILNRAEVLASQGGGEVRVQLNPANLGQVQLMVKVNEGRVNVQMVTESDQAKRMIEGGLRDLRTELNESNLKLDGLQVDVSKSSSSDLKQSLEGQGQNLQEQARNMAQDFARGFLGQNRDERMWQREQFLADPMARPGNGNYGKSRIEDRAAEATSKSQGTSGTAKRLNVVA
jgi:flagellar hook-length control protein FliK